MTIFQIIDAVIAFNLAVAIPMGLAVLIRTARSAPVPKPVTVRVRSRRR